MTAEGHLLFSISCAIFAKNAELTPNLMQGDWWHIVPSTILTCLLPDIDHPQSFLGQRLKWISRPISRIFGHRGFTHSLLAIFSFSMLLYSIEAITWIVPKDAIQGMVVGYMSHILADLLTPAGIPLLWPFHWRLCLPILTLKKNNRLERILCIAFFIYAIWIPEIFPENGAVNWLSKTTNFLQIQFNHLINSENKR